MAGAVLGRGAGGNGQTLGRSTDTSQNTALIIVDVAANLPTATTKGQLFVAWDTSTIYYDNGTEWTVIIQSPLNITVDNGIISIAFEGATYIQIDTATGFVHAGRWIQGLLT